MKKNDEFFFLIFRKFCSPHVEEEYTWCCAHVHSMSNELIKPIEGFEEDLEFLKISLLIHQLQVLDCLQHVFCSSWVG